MNLPYVFILFKLQKNKKPGDSAAARFLGGFRYIESVIVNTLLIFPIIILTWATAATASTLLISKIDYWLGYEGNWLFFFWGGTHVIFSLLMFIKKLPWLRASASIPPDRYIISCWNMLLFDSPFWFQHFILCPSSSDVISPPLPFRLKSVGRLNMQPNRVIVFVGRGAQRFFGVYSRKSPFTFC